MKLIFGGIIIAAIFVTGFSSCQKGIDGGINNNTQSDSIYIKSFYILDASRPAGQDTALKFFFDYDNQKRIERLREYHYEFPVNPINFTSDVRFSYAGNDTMPSILYSYASYFASVYDTVYLKYINGKIIRDSSAYGVPGSPKAFIRYDFQQLNNNLYTGSYIDSVVGFQSTLKTVNSFINWQQGNLVAEKDTIHYFNGAPDYTQSKDFTYDQKQNPLRKAVLSFPTTAFYFNTITMAQGNVYLNSFANCSANNILTEISSPSFDLVTWSYTYSSNGLPKTAIRKVSSSIYKIYYYYTSL